MSCEFFLSLLCFLWVEEGDNLLGARVQGCLIITSLRETSAKVGSIPSSSPSLSSYRFWDEFYLKILLGRGVEEEGRLCRAWLTQVAPLGWLWSRQESRDTLQLTGTPEQKIFSKQRLLQLSADPGVCQPFLGHF